MSDGAAICLLEECYKETCCDTTGCECDGTCQCPTCGVRCYCSGPCTCGIGCTGFSDCKCAVGACGCRPTNSAKP
ncbi:metallothionein 10-Ia-like [Pecten maximus]|uniref:metallothionein 10-Ia-like n=1 Tax=Pecten maximus TaxID=6579 RepID=UPI001458238A|nr:metallothionein 10-Ia-like [Pecten maximus]